MSSLDWPAKGLSCPVLDDDGSELADDDEGSENSESEVGSDGRIVAGLGIMVVERASTQLCLGGGGRGQEARRRC